MGRTKPAISPPGSVADTVAHLAVWGRRAPKGLARVVFSSEYSRQAAVRQLRATLKESKTPFHQLDLPLFQPAVEVVRFLVNQLGKLESGIVSIAGFATAFADEEMLADSLRVLNFNRENLARFPLCQLWWMPRHFADTFIQAVPDLSSWFMVRLRLDEAVPPLSKLYVPFEPHDPIAVSTDKARRRSHYLSERTTQAIKAGQPSEEILNDLLIPAVESLFGAGLQQEANELRRRLIQRLAASGWEIDAPSIESILQRRVERAEDWAVRIADQEKATAHSLDVYEKALGPDHPDTAMSLNTLANLLSDQGKLAEAEPLYRRSLAIHEATLGPDHPDTAGNLGNLANLLWNQGKLAEAEPLYRRSLAIHERTFGPDHPDTAGSLNNLAIMLRELGKLAEAEPLLRRSLAIYEAALGPDHPKSVSQMKQLSSLLPAMGREAEAKLLISRMNSLETGTHD